MVEGAIRKRNKPSLSCTNCRARKTKCDRLRPCSSCVHLKKVDSCFYDAIAPPKASKPPRPSLPKFLASKNGSLLNDVKTRDNISPSSTDQETENEESLLQEFLEKTRSPIAPSDEVIRFHEGYDPVTMHDISRRLYSGPLSWVTFLKKDALLNIAWSSPVNGVSPHFICPGLTYSDDKKNVFIINQEELTEGEKVDSTNSFRKIALEQDSLDEVIPVASINGSKDIHPNYVALSKSLFDGRLDTETHLVAKIRKIMPTKKTIWLLMDRFFERLYPIIPLVDKDIKEKLSAIIGPPSYEDVPLSEFKIVKKMDLAVIALCLLMMRITFLFHFSNRRCRDDFIIRTFHPSVDLDTKHILTHPINLVVIDVAQSCIDCFSVSRKPNITVFQAMLFMRIYRILSPESGGNLDGGGLSISTSILIEVANLLGLNREPDYFKQLSGNERQENLCRKMWHFLMRIDTININSILSPMIVDMDRQDTKEPYVDSKNTRPEDIEEETAIVSTFNWVNRRVRKLEVLSKLILNVRDPPAINDLTRTMEDVEFVTHKELYTLTTPSFKNWDNISYVDKCAHATKTKGFLSLKCSLLSLYYHIYMHYEPKCSDYAFSYLKKIFYVFAYEVSDYFFEMLKGRFAMFGFILNPDFQAVLHRIYQFSIALVARVKLAQYLMSNDEHHAEKLTTDVAHGERYVLLTDLAQNVHRLCELLQRVIETLSTKYYYAWRLSKAHKYILKSTEDVAFYKKAESQKKTASALPFSVKKLDELRTYVNVSVSKLEELIQYKDSINKIPDMDIYIDQINSASISTETSPRSDIFEKTQGTIDQVWLKMMSMEGNVFDSNDSELDNMLFGDDNLRQPVEAGFNGNMSPDIGSFKFDYDNFMSAILGRDWTT